DGIRDDLVTGVQTCALPISGIAFRLVEILLEAGVPAGVLAFLPAPGDVGAQLVRHADVAFVVFTGSKAVGLSIVAEAAVHRPGQIGRASCRGRGGRTGGSVR